MEVQHFTPETIINATCEVLNVQKEVLISSSRKREAADARYVAMILFNKRTDLTLYKIGQLLGNRNHTTIWHGIKSGRDLMKTDSGFRKKVSQVLEKLEEKAW